MITTSFFHLPAQLPLVHIITDYFGSSNKVPSGGSLTFIYHALAKLQFCTLLHEDCHKATFFLPDAYGSFL
jgi:hypothetical protein